MIGALLFVGGVATGMLLTAVGIWALIVVSWVHAPMEPGE